MMLGRNGRIAQSAIDTAAREGKKRFILARTLILPRRALPQRTECNNTDEKGAGQC
jgi:hypothetical protein